MTMLTETVRQICRDNYATNCGGCPINRACIDLGNSTRTFETMDEWRRRVNEAAARYIEERGN